MLALPLTLALQWGLQSRYLDRPAGVAQLAGRRRCAPRRRGCARRPAGGRPRPRRRARRAARRVTWTGGTLLVGCRRAARLRASSCSRDAGDDRRGRGDGRPRRSSPRRRRSRSALALRAAHVPARPTPGRWARAIAAARSAPGSGSCSSLDRSVELHRGRRARPSPCCPRPWPALGRLSPAPPRAGDPAGGVGRSPVATRTRAGRAWPPLRVLLGARRPASSAARRGAVARAPRRHRRGWARARAAPACCVGFGLVALATLLVGLLEAMGRGRWALVAVACAAGGRGWPIRVAGERAVRGHRPGRRRRRSRVVLVLPGRHR